MTTLANITITTAVTGFVTPPMQFLEGPPLSLSVEANFTYGSGGTSVDAWLQTSLDGGTTWCDMAEFSFTTASARKGPVSHHPQPLRRLWQPTERLRPTA